MADIVLINPRFEVSYWGLEHALPLLRRRAVLPAACLPLLAALTPAEHRVTLVDENVEPLDYDRLARADLVGLTGMSVQRRRMRDILGDLRRRGIFTVVGGPWASVREQDFTDLADVVFVGEADETWPSFLSEWRLGRHRPRYEQAARTDLSQLPVPRWDLLKMRHYLCGSIQCSRGCPYQCEFCDIIVTFGRRPRLKTAPQVIRELEALRQQRLDLVFIVDDNLIGNKKEIKSLLKAVAEWQRASSYPMTFFTEASLDLAEEPDLLELMVEANVTSVFVGIESPNEASLRETRKFQNLRQGHSAINRVHTIQDAGLEVWSGMILGFDQDDHSIFEAQLDFLREARVLHAMLGMLYAIPKTPLYERLSRENRLDEDHEGEFGTNVLPSRLTRTELRAGYLQLLNDLYAPEAYFERFEQLYLRDGFRFGQARAAYWRRHPWHWLTACLRNLARSAGLCWQLGRHVPDPALRCEYRNRLLRLLRARPDTSVLFVFLLKCAMHFHHYTLARNMAARPDQIVNTF